MKKQAFIKSKLKFKFSLCIFVLLLLIMPIFLLLSCDDGNNGKQNTDDKGYVSVNLVLLDEAGNPVEGDDVTRASSINCSQVGLDKLQFLMYDEYGNGLAGAEEYCETHKVKIGGITPGINRSLKVYGKDVNSKVIYKGEVFEININKGQFTPVFVELNPVSENPVTQNSPVITITSPVNMASFYEGTNITFSATVTDTEDGTISGNALRWESNINGQIGFGNSFTISSLWVGSHKVTLTAYDSSGLQGTASITIVVTQKSNTVPSVAINSPSNNSSFNQGTSVSFSGSATDPEDGTLSGSSLVWTSSKDGQLGTGTSFSKSS
ncbi:MAG: hypothetical protein HQK76_13510, partial [Desulfobacterales bacterium]|nr:hypothetical protein [Desulfobacterales bacterium]